MKKGFTLIELLAVVAIIGMLSVMIIPGVVKLFNGAVGDSMKVTENEVLDAANLYLEDYCRNPIDDEHRTNCNEDKHEVAGNKVYFCLSTLQSRDILKEVYYKEASSCSGFVIYDFVNYKYTNGKVYLYCGNEYVTEGGSAYQSYLTACR